MIVVDVVTLFETYWITVTIFRNIGLDRLNICDNFAVSSVSGMSTTYCYFLLKSALVLTVFTNSRPFSLPFCIYSTFILKSVRLYEA